MTYLAAIFAGTIAFQSIHQVCYFGGAKKRYRSVQWLVSPGATLNLMYPSGQIVFWVDQKYSRAREWSDVCCTPIFDRVSSTVKSKSRTSPEYPVRYPATPLCGASSST